MSTESSGGLPPREGTRLQKFLASAGVASRRKAEELILAGRVKVNERVVTELGTKVEPGKDLVTVDGKLVSRAEGRSYYLLYKPGGCVTTASDPQGRPTALEYLHGVPERVFSVGRLDYDAEGAVLFTDDGELANRLAHPRYGHRRVYLVKVRGDPDPTALERMLAGVRLEDGPAKALEVAVHERAEKNVWIRVVVGEGRHHLVKRLCEAVGLFVQRLFRPEFGGVTVEGLRPGQFRALTEAELKAMRMDVGLEPSARSEREPAPPRPLRRDLPRAARRHGHGPPLPPERGGPKAERGGPRVRRDEGAERAGAGAERGGSGGRRGERGDARGERGRSWEPRGERAEAKGRSGGSWSKPKAGSASPVSRRDAPKARTEGSKPAGDRAKPGAPGRGASRRGGTRPAPRDRRGGGPRRGR